MIKVNIQWQDNFQNDSQEIKKELKKLPQDSLQKFVSLTPIDTGNARNNTKLSGNTIEAKYAYAQRLDQGYSKQAPQGMTKPFDKWLENRFRRIFGN